MTAIMELSLDYCDELVSRDDDSFCFVDRVTLLDIERELFTQTHDIDVLGGDVDPSTDDCPSEDITVANPVLNDCMWCHPDSLPSPIQSTSVRRASDRIAVDVTPRANSRSSSSRTVSNSSTLSTEDADDQCDVIATNDIISRPSTHCQPSILDSHPPFADVTSIDRIHNYSRSHLTLRLGFNADSGSGLAAADPASRPTSPVVDVEDGPPSCSGSPSSHSRFPVLAATLLTTGQVLPEVGRQFAAVSVDCPPSYQVFRPSDRRSLRIARKRRQQKTSSRSGGITSGRTRFDSVDSTSSPSSSSSSSESSGEPSVDTATMSRRRRSVLHNALERQRRNRMKSYFDTLRRCVMPAVPDARRTSNVTVLRKAVDYVHRATVLRRRMEEQLRKLKAIGEQLTRRLMTTVGGGDRGVVCR